MKRPSLLPIIAFCFCFCHYQEVAIRELCFVQLKLLWINDILAIQFLCWSLVSSAYSSSFFYNRFVRGGVSRRVHYIRLGHASFKTAFPRLILFIFSMLFIIIHICFILASCSRISIFRFSISVILTVQIILVIIPSHILAHIAIVCWSEPSQINARCTLWSFEFSLLKFSLPTPDLAFASISLNSESVNLLLSNYVSPDVS